MIKALFLNCSLKGSKKISNTQAVINKAILEYKKLGVGSESIRLSDYNIKYGVTSDEGNGDEWPIILKKIKSSDIVILGTPIWFGTHSSIAQQVFERLDDTYTHIDENNGHFGLYNKVGGVIVTGNEDGAKTAASRILYNLFHLGCVIPPNADSYWVGKAGPGPSYIDAKGEKDMYTNKTYKFLVHNTYFFAKLLKNNPIDTNLNKLIEDAQKESE